MLVNMFGIEEDDEIVRIGAPDAALENPKERVSLTTLVGVLMQSYASAQPAAASPAVPAVSPIGTALMVVDTPDAAESADEGRWHAA